MDVLWLSRFQFALTIMFHYLFPPLTIGIGVVLSADADGEPRLYITQNFSVPADR